MLVALAAVLEVVLRTAVPASNRPEAYFNPTDRVWRVGRDGERQGLATFGPLAQQRAVWRINNDGWNSAIDYQARKSRPRIAVIGDSYIEALQVDADKNYPDLLGYDLGSKWDVYAFGVSGAPLSQYLQMARYVVPKYDPDVVLINIIHNDFHESLAARAPLTPQFLRLREDGGEMHEIPPAPDYSASQFSVSKRVLKNAALVRYLYYNLQLRRGAVALRTWLARRDQKQYNANVDVASIRQSTDEIERAIDYVFGALNSEFPDLRFIIVMDAPRPEIYDDEPPLGGSVLFLNNLVEEASMHYGFEFLDLTEPMKRAFAETGIRYETPWDGHWNGYGHEFVAAQLLPYFESAESTARLSP